MKIDQPFIKMVLIGIPISIIIVIHNALLSYGYGNYTTLRYYDGYYEWTPYGGIINLLFALITVAVCVLLPKLLSLISDKLFIKEKSETGAATHLVFDAMAIFALYTFGHFVLLNYSILYYREQMMNIMIVYTLYAIAIKIKAIYFIRKARQHIASLLSNKEFISMVEKICTKTIKFDSFEEVRGLIPLLVMFLFMFMAPEFLFLLIIALLIIAVLSKNIMIKYANIGKSKSTNHILDAFIIFEFLWISPLYAMLFSKPHWVCVELVLFTLGLTLFQFANMKNSLRKQIYNAFTKQNSKTRYDSVCNQFPSVYKRNI